MKKNILVLYGGKSVEHEISIITGLQLLENIDKNKYKIIPVYISRDGQWFKLKNYSQINTYKNIEKENKKLVSLITNSMHLYEKTIFGYRKREKIDCVYLCTHGTNCEDGSLQGLIKSTGIAFTGSSVLSSAIGMDKIIMKDIFRANNIPCVKYKYFSKNEAIDYEKINLVYPLIVKPANLGSSIGINKCKNISELKSAIEIAFQYDDRVIVEEAVVNIREINCSVIGNEKIELSKLEEPLNWSEFLTFEEKYINNRKKSRNFKVKIKKSLKREIYSLAEKVYKVFCCSGVVRIDFILDELSSKVYVNEINTIPGSLAFYLWEDKRKFSEHIDYTIDLALQEKNKADGLIYDYSSTALDCICKGRKLNK